MNSCKERSLWKRWDVNKKLWICRFLPARRIRKIGLCYGNVAGWLGGWLAGCHTPVLYQSILKLCQPSGSSILLVFWPLAPIPNSKGNAFSGGYKYTGCGKLAIFDRNRRLSQKRCEIGRWLLWNVNRKSWVPDRNISFSMTLSQTRVSRSLYTSKSNISIMA